MPARDSSSYQRGSSEQPCPVEMTEAADEVLFVDDVAVAVERAGTEDPECRCCDDQQSGQRIE